MQNEISYLSACLVDSGVIDAHPLAVDHFTGGRREIYAVMKRLHNDGVPFDFTVLASECPKAWKTSGSDIVTSNGLPSVAGYFASKVKEDAVARELLGIQTLITQGLDNGMSPQEIRADIERVLANITVSAGASQVKDIVHSAMRMLDAGKGVPFAFVAIDKVFIGFNPGDFVVLAARPGMGKSALAANLAEYHGRKQRKILIFSLEMTKEQWVCRIACSMADVNYQEVLDKKLSKTEQQRLLAAMQEVSTFSIVIDDTPAIDIHDLRAIVRREKPAITVVDYLQLVTCKAESRFQEVSEVSRQLKACAKESGTAVLALSQLNRSLESRSDKRPTLSDLRESGQIEQDADCIMFIYRESVYCERCRIGDCNDPHRMAAEVEIAKQRSGKTGVAFLRWFGDRMMFADKEDYR